MKINDKEYPVTALTRKQVRILRKEYDLDFFGLAAKLDKEGIETFSTEIVDSVLSVSFPDKKDQDALDECNFMDTMELFNEILGKSFEGGEVKNSSRSGTGTTET